VTAGGSDQLAGIAGRETGLTRREFLSLAGGVVVFFALGESARLQAGLPAAKPGLPDELTAWLRIAPEGRVTIFAPTPEVGQGLRTCLAQLAAEELSVPVASVEAVLGDTDRVPPDPGMCESEAISVIGPYVRQAAAQAREILRDLAAASWGVAHDEVVLRAGRAVLASDPSKSAPIGDLVRGQNLSHALEPPVALKPFADCTVIGQPIRRLDGPGYVRGRARYAADIRLPNLAYARVLRPPCVGATLVKADTRAAAAQPGVIAVVQGDDFVGIVANRPDVADRALLSVAASWDEPDRPSVSTLYQDLRSSAKLEEKLGVKGDVEAALAAARHGFSASYRLPFGAHAPMEPHCAVADPKDDRMIVYACTQRPFRHRDAVARALGMSAGRVRVITTAVGGAFGGKDAPDVSVQAARLAQAVRRPVMVTQSREEEMAWNTFRPAAIIDIRSGVSAAGQIVAWDSDVLNCGSRGAVAPYDFANQRVRSYRCESPLPQGPARALGAPASTFAREVHLDYIAAEIGIDPIGLRLRHLTADPRLQGVVQVLSERYGWDERRPPTGQGVGFALGVDAGACAAVIAEVEVDRASGQVRVRRVWVAQDAGLVINPDNARNQIEGGVVMGLGLALKEAVQYQLGQVLSRSFATYPIPTFRDAPDIEVVLMPNPDLPPRGDTTAAFCAIAPAVANAVFDTTGKRLRDLPLAPAVMRSGQ
jgi:isoquinoline 1-oxidoreductase